MDRPLDSKQADFGVKQHCLLVLAVFLDSSSTLFMLPMPQIKSHPAGVPRTTGTCMVYVGSKRNLSRKEPLYTHTLIAGQLEAALALANQRIAELEAQVKALQGTVQGLQEGLAAAQTQNATLQVLLCLRRACNVHKRPAFRTSQLPKVSVVTIMLGGRTIQAALTCFVGFSADQSRSLNQQLTAGLAFLVTTAQ